MRWRGRRVCRRRMSPLLGAMLVLGAHATARANSAPEPETDAPAPPSAPGDSPPTVSLALADPAPIIGVTAQTELHIEMTDSPESPVPMPRVLCSAGQVEGLTRTGPTTFVARYVLPTSRFPQPAIVVAEFSSPLWPIRGMTTLRLRAAATPALHTDPGAQVTIRVGDRDFGPQAAARDGMVHIPVVVPPGVDFGVARSVNPYGKATEQVLDLRVPYSQRLLFVAPRSLAAGSTAEVAVYAVEVSGRPADASAIIVRAPGIGVQPLGSRIPGEARFLVGAPRILKVKTLTIEALLKNQSTTRIATTIALVAARATGLSLDPEAARLHRKPGSSLRIFLGAEDAFGNPVDAARASVLVDGKLAEVKASSDGAPMVVVHSPEPVGRQDAVRVEGMLDSAHAVRRIPIGVWQRPQLPWPDLPAATLSPRYTLTPRLGPLWNLGSQTGAALFVDAVAYRSSRHPGLGLGLSVGLLQTWFAAQSEGGTSRTWLTTVPVLVQIRQRFIVDRTFLGFGVGAGFAMSFARIHAYETTVFGRGYGAAGEAMVETGYLLHRGHLAFSLRYLAVYLDELTSGDRIVGNAAGAIADVGYRLVW